MCLQALKAVPKLFSAQGAFYSHFQLHKDGKASPSQTGGHRCHPGMSLCLCCPPPTCPAPSAQHSPWWQRTSGSCTWRLRPPHSRPSLPPPHLPPASFLYWSNHLELHTLLIFSSSAFPLGGEGALFLFFLNANPCFSQLSSSVLISAFIGFRQWVLCLHCCSARIHPLCNGVHCTTWAAPSGCGDSRGAAASPQAPIAAAAPQLLTDIRKLPGESSYQITAVSTVLIARGAVR